MKKFKKLTALLTGALLTVTSLGITAFAAEAPEQGNLTIHKYQMDDVSQAGEPGTGETTTPPEDATPLQGVNFSVYPVNANADGKVPKNEDITLTKTGDTVTGFTSDGTAYTVGTVQQKTTGADGTAAFTGLDRGYYLVVEEVSENIDVAPAAPFVVAVPMSNQEGTGWIDDVHVYPKNQTLTTTKAPNTPSVFVGETVTWTIGVTVPPGIANAQKFAVTDVLDADLDYVENSVKVTGLASATATSGKEIPMSGNFTASENSGTLTVEFTTAGMKQLADYKKINVTFDTKVGEGILEKTEPVYTVKNSADVEFTNKDGQTVKFETNESQIHTGAVKIEKLDANTNTALPGAEFHIATSSQKAIDGDFLKIGANGEILDTDDAGYAEAGDWKITSNEEGIAEFKGLKTYTEADGEKTYNSYWIVETKAPEGFNLLNEAVQVTFDETTAVESASYTISTTIKNTTGFTLPKTGDIGTILFTVAGVGLIGAAVILLIASRKRKEETE